MNAPAKRSTSSYHPAAVILLVTTLLLAGAPAAFAQAPPGLVVISAADASSAPTVVIQATGMDGQGQPLALNPADVTIQHGGEPVPDVQLAGEVKVGTFTVFLVDVPPGVVAQLPAAQQAIEQFASLPTMEERVDYIAIYRVEAQRAGQLLAPTNFYNTVRNFFVEPFEPQSGQTALVDSVGGLLGEIEALRPNQAMITSLVVLSDGTDAVSTAFEPEALGPLAAEQGIPVHTIWLANQDLQPFSHQAGQDYLAGLAAASRGLTARLDDPAAVQQIWERIAAFRSHKSLQYTVPELAPGTFDVTLSLRDAPAAADTVAVTIPDAAPSVVINLPAESRQLTLESLDEPVAISLSTTVTWLDGQERALQSAELLVNGIVAQTIDPDQIAQFRAEVPNFLYGANIVQVAVVDELGQRATSPPITLAIVEGETSLPEEIQATGPLTGALPRFLMICGGLLIAVAIAAIAISRGRQPRATPSWLGRLPRPKSPPEEAAPGRRSRRQPRPPAPASAWEEPTAFPLEPEPGVVGQEIVRPVLEILQSTTRMPPALELTDVEHRIGRSPVQADIVFENDITVSRLHASIVLEGQDYRLYDEGSTSGTLVNDRRVPEYGHQLRDGDEIRLGAVRLRYRHR